MVEAELYVHAQPSTQNFGRTQRVREGGISAVNATIDECMVFANNVVRALQSVCSQVAIGQVVAGQTLVSRNSGGFENRERETWQSTRVNLFGH